MYLRDLPKAIKNVSRHLDAEGAALLICGSPTDEYQRIVDLLVEENVRTVAFYSRFEENLSNHFAFEKKTLKGQLDFPDFEEVLRCFRRELKEEYQKDINDRQEEKLREFFQKQGRPTVERDSRAYICRHL
jgi:hypothetical protein